MNRNPYEPPETRDTLAAAELPAPRGAAPLSVIILATLFFLAGAYLIADSLRTLIELGARFDRCIDELQRLFQASFVVDPRLNDYQRWVINPDRPSFNAEILQAKPPDLLQLPFYPPEQRLAPQDAAAIEHVVHVEPRYLVRIRMNRGVVRDSGQSHAVVEARAAHTFEGRTVPAPADAEGI